MKFAIFLSMGLLGVGCLQNLGAENQAGYNNNTNVNVNETHIQVETLIPKKVVEQISAFTTRQISHAESAWETVSLAPSGLLLGCETLVAKLVANKWRVLMWSALGGYVYLNYTATRTKQQLQDAQRWCNWKYQLSLEELFAVDPKELGVLLMKEIQQRYLSTENPADFVTPVACFMQDFEYEQQLLAWYLWLGKVFDTVHLTNYSWYDQNLCERCREWQRRLAYLKATFLNWMAEYNISNHATATPATAVQSPVQAALGVFPRPPRSATQKAGVARFCVLQVKRLAGLWPFSRFKSHVS